MSFRAPLFRHWLYRATPEVYSSQHVPPFAPSLLQQAHADSFPAHRKAARQFWNRSRMEFSSAISAAPQAELCLLPIDAAVAAAISVPVMTIRRMNFILASACDGDNIPKRVSGLGGKDMRYGTTDCCVTSSFYTCTSPTNRICKYHFRERGVW